MASTYRCYLLDHDHVVSTEELECENASAALLGIRRLLTTSTFTAAHIWTDARSSPAA